MCVQELFDLPRIDIFASADDHVFRPAGDLYVSVFAHQTDVTCVQPTFGVNGAIGRLLVGIVSFHDHVAARTDFTRLADRHGFAIHDRSYLHLGAWERLANR